MRESYRMKERRVLLAAEVKRVVPSGDLEGRSASAKSDADMGGRYH